jgi:hypothetical protein
VAIAALLATPAAEPAPRRSPSAPRFAALLRGRSARRWLGAEVVAFAVWTSLLTFVGACFIERFGVPEAAAGWLLAARAAAHFSAASRSGSLVSLIARRRLVCGSALTMAVRFVVLTLADSVLPAAATFCLLGLAAGIRWRVQRARDLARDRHGRIGRADPPRRRSVASPATARITHHSPRTRVVNADSLGHRTSFAPVACPEPASGGLFALIRGGAIPTPPLDGKVLGSARS